MFDDESIPNYQNDLMEKFFGDSLESCSKYFFEHLMEYFKRKLKFVRQINYYMGDFLQSRTLVNYLIVLIKSYDQVAEVLDQRLFLINIRCILVILACDIEHSGYINLILSFPSENIFEDVTNLYYSEGYGDSLVILERDIENHLGFLFLTIQEYFDLPMLKELDDGDYEYIITICDLIVLIYHYLKKAIPHQKKTRGMEPTVDFDLIKFDELVRTLENLERNRKKMIKIVKNSLDVNEGK